ncbi:hypothetical protein AG1IA_07302 [Rhizoctonia solani AG-1 IA]|uniref:Uncharacterized protein n=1 Tax=Thanatephorus cucumeris (strain AG1-IA) TaxID=983506 RepID=L8WPG7_THACA|nr:hypothetical protein AG1IA_07302 [Rhizoctonia solani AG-1 IA]
MEEGRWERRDQTPSVVNNGIKINISVPVNGLHATYRSRWVETSCGHVDLRVRDVRETLRMSLGFHKFLAAISTPSLSGQGTTRRHVVQCPIHIGPQARRDEVEELNIPIHFNHIPMKSTTLSFSVCVLGEQSFARV